MATGSGEITPADQGAVGGQEDLDMSKVTFEDGKGEGKKKKLKPLERMFKFFKSGKKRSKSKERDASIASVKSKSTSALHKEVPHGEEEEDGGFKRLPLGGSRSISEDSVFNPDTRDLSGIRKSALSMENIKQDFQSELFSKLRKRKSTMSSDEDDDDYGFRPSTQVTFDDVTGRGRSKPPPVEPKPGSLNSSTGLIEQVEDDLFNMSWQDSVVGSRSQRSNNSSGTAMDLDFNAVKSDSQVLESDAAKHKISIKPKSRRASSQRNRTKSSTAVSALPQLKEESPLTEIPPGVTLTTPKPQEDVKSVETKPTKEEVKVTDGQPKVKVPEDGAATRTQDQEPLITVKDNMTSIQIGGTDKPTEGRTGSPSLEIGTGSPSKRWTMIEGERDKMPGLPVSSVALGAVKLRPGVRPRPKSLIEPPQIPQPGGDELAKIFNKRMSVRKERTDEDFSEDSFLDSKKDSVEVNPVVLPSEAKKTSPTGTAPPLGGVTYVLKKEPLRKTSSDNAKAPHLKAVSEEPKTTEQPKPKQSDTKVDAVKTPVTKKDTIPPAVQEKSKSLSNKLASPREEYRLKRQARSKTLPEPPVTQELLDKKLAETTETENNLSKSLVSRQESIEGKTDSVSSALSKKTEPKRLSLKDSQTNSSEPSWFALARKKQADADQEEKDSSKKENSPPLQSVAAKSTPVPVGAKPSSVGAKPTPVQPSVGAKPTPVQSSVGAKPTPVQSSVGAKATPLQPSVGAKPTVTPVGAKTTLSQSVGTKSNAFGGTKPITTNSQNNTSSANKEGSPSVRSFRDKVADKSDSTPFNRASTRSSGFSSKEEKEKINGNKKAPETKKESEPVQRTLSNRSKIETAKSFGSNGGGSQASTSSSSTVPAWKANLAKRKEKEPQIKIEIIEKTMEQPVPSKKPATKALEEKVTLRDKPVVDKCSAKRQSKVLDMVKSFQKLEVS